MHARAEGSTEIASEMAPSWPEDIFAILQRFDVRQVPYVPDAGHSQLIERVLGAPAMSRCAVDHGRGRRGVARRRLGWRPARRSAHAVVGRRQLRQHAVADAVFRCRSCYW